MKLFRITNFQFVNVEIKYKPDISDELHKFTDL